MSVWYQNQNLKLKLILKMLVWKILMVPWILDDCLSKWSLPQLLHYSSFCQSLKPPLMTGGHFQYYYLFQLPGVPQNPNHWPRIISLFFCHHLTNLSSLVRITLRPLWHLTTGQSESWERYMNAPRSNISRGNSERILKSFSGLGFSLCVK